MTDHLRKGVDELVQHHQNKPSNAPSMSVMQLDLLSTSSALDGNTPTGNGSDCFNWRIVDGYRVEVWPLQLSNDRQLQVATAVEGGSPFSASHAALNRDSAAAAKPHTVREQW